MAWTNLTYSFGSVLTSTKLTQNQDNFTAVATGLSGAPQINRAALKSVTAAGSVSIGATSNGSYTLTGADYSWWTASASAQTYIGGGSNLAAGVIGLATGAGSSIIYFDERYIQASPPYKYGPVFVMLALNPAGEIIASRVSLDPVWAHNGPTNIAAEFEREGKFYRKNKYLNGVPLLEALKNTSLKRKFLSGELAADDREEEIDLDYKDRDSHIVPHGFGGLPESTTYVLVRPATSLMDRLHEIVTADSAKSVLDIFTNEYIKIDRESEILLPGLPKIIKSCDANWRLTGG